MFFDNNKSEVANQMEFCAGLIYREYTMESMIQRKKENWQSIEIRINYLNPFFSY